MGFDILKQKEDKKGVLKTFTCPWCGKEFNSYLKTSSGDKHSKQSNQVRCPNCKGFIKSI